MSEPQERREPPPAQVDTPDTLAAPLVDGQGSTTYADIEVAAPPGFRPLRMDVTVPASDSEQVPVVAYIHGGAFMFGSRRHGPVTSPIRDALLQRGIAFAAVEYRLSGEAQFPACLHDVKAAVRWLRKFGSAVGVDGTRIGAWGESAGAHLATFLALNNSAGALNGTEGVTGVSSDVTVAVAWYPPTRFLTMDAEAPANAPMRHDAADSPESRLVGGPIQEHREQADFASPVNHAGGNAAPILLLHGVLDRIVPHQQSVAMQRALEAAGADVTLELVQGADHVFEGVDVAPLVARSVDFLAVRLG